MAKIYTKTGDTGKTGLFGGKRVPKSDIKLNAYGTVDELNSYLGMLLNYPSKYISTDYIKKLQSDLFVIGSHLAKNPDKEMNLPEINEDDILEIEREIDRMVPVLPELKSFILPGGSVASSYCHIARTVCRRAERGVVALNDIETVNPVILKYLNRLSDFLFVLARIYLLELGISEIPWIPKK